MRGLLLLCALGGCADPADPNIDSTASDESGGGGRGASGSSAEQVPSTGSDGVNTASSDRELDGASPEPSSFAITTNLGGSSGASQLFAALDSVCWLDAARTRISCSGPPGTRSGGFASRINEQTTLSFSLGSEVRQIVLGSYHGCALLESTDPERQVVCWGQNELGQLGVGDTEPREPSSPDALLPVDLGTGAVVLQIAAGEALTCALLEGGTVKCWGAVFWPPATSFDRVGDEPGEMGDALQAVDFGQRTVAMLAGAKDGLCFGFEDHTVACAGMNTFGQLGQGDTVRRIDDPAEFPSDIDLGTAVTPLALFGGYEAYCALLESAAAGTGVKCWGSNYYGELALGDTNDRGDEPGEMGDALPFAQLGEGRVVELGLGDTHACALFDDRRVKCWGSMTLGDGLNEVPQFGATQGTIGNAIFDYDFGAKVPVQVVSGTWFACARFEDGDFGCWGRWMPYINVH